MTLDRNQSFDRKMWWWWYIDAWEAWIRDHMHKQFSKEKKTNYLRNNNNLQVHAKTMFTILRRQLILIKQDFFELIEVPYNKMVVLVRKRIEKISFALGILFYQNVVIQKTTTNFVIIQILIFIQTF